MKAAFIPVISVSEIVLLVACLLTLVATLLTEICAYLFPATPECLETQHRLA